MQQIVFAYVPVLHRGYQEFFAKYPNADLYLLKREELMQFAQLEYLKKDIRVLDLELALQAIKSWDIFKIVKSINIDDVDQKKYSLTTTQLIFTNDDVGHFVASKFFKNYSNKLFESIFLRWDEASVNDPKIVEGIKISKTQFEKATMIQAFVEAGKSSDWWRHVGCCLVKQGQIIAAAYNQHLPCPDQQYKVADPRMSFSSGVGIEFASSIHAEAALIARAAKAGLALAGAEIYVTTFPCPICAKQIAEAGIKKVYYAKGYALLDGLEIFQAYGIEVNLVVLTDQELSELEQIENANCLVKKRYSLI